MVRKWKHASPLAVALALVVALVATSCAPTGPPAVGEKSIKIGLSLILTGPISTTGVPMAEPTMAYLNYVNDELGGIEYRDPETGRTERVKLDIMWEDNGYNVPKGIIIHKRQSAAGAMLRMTHSASEADAICEMVSREHMPLVGAQVTPLMMKPKPRYITATYPTYADECGAMVLWILQNWKEPRPPKIGLMGADATGVRSSLVHFTPEKGAALGVEVVGTEWVPLAVTDSTIELTRLKLEEVDYVYLIHVVGATVVIVKDAERLGIKDRLFLSFTTNEETLIRLLGDMVEGMPGALASASPEEDLPEVRLAHRIIRKYYNHDATALNLEMWPQAPVAVEGLRLALERVGYENLTREAVNEGIHSVTNLDVGGVVPPVTIDPDWPLIDNHIKISVIQGGEFKVVSDWIDCPAIVPRD